MNDYQYKRIITTETHLQTFFYLVDIDSLTYISKIFSNQSIKLQEWSG